MPSDPEASSFLPSEAERYLKVHAQRRPPSWARGPEGSSPAPRPSPPTIANWHPVLHAQKTTGGVVFATRSPSLSRSLRSPPAARIRTGAGADGEVCFAQI